MLIIIFIFIRLISNLFTCFHILLHVLVIPWQLALVHTNYISFGNVKGCFFEEQMGIPIARKKKKFKFFQK